MKRNTKIQDFNRLLADNLKPLLQFAYLRCNDYSLAEDLTQETCLKAYKSYLQNGKEILKPKEWLFKILINTHISYLRKKQIQYGEFKDDISNNLVDNNGFEENGYYESSEIIKEAFSKLNQEQREVIYLVDVKGHSFKEASNMLGISLGTLASRLFRGRNKLKEEVKKIETVYKKSLVGHGL